jgi:hypothetical protein
MSPEDWADLVSEPHTYVITTFIFRDNQFNYYHNGGTNVSPGTGVGGYDGHTMLFGAYDENIDYDGVSYPYGFVNSWSSYSLPGVNDLVWFSGETLSHMNILDTLIIRFSYAD